MDRIDQDQATEDQETLQGMITVTVTFLSGGQMQSEVSYSGIDQVNAGIVLIDLGRNLLVGATKHEHPHHH